MLCVASSLHRTMIAVTVLAVMPATFGSPVWGQASDPKKLPADHAERMAKGLVMFEQNIAGLLKQHCVKCHGGEKTRGDFDLATREGLLKGGESGPAVVPFHADESLIYKVISHTEEPTMPAQADKLPDDVIQKIKVWIDHGAPYDKPLIAGKKPPRDGSKVTDADRAWWAFQPLAKVVPPNPIAVPPGGNDVDRFILAKAAEKGLTLPPLANHRQRLRRATFDLHGLPPTPEELAAFQSDMSAEAWNTVVDRLLENPRYGERWARHWLDVARFAESHGFEHDYDRPGAWAFRDFVIKALNADMPYTQFTHWQLAGDELAPTDPLALSATGFLGAGVFPTQITANEVERTRYDALDDMLSTTSSAFLGLTVGCARCHDHKFDPIPTRDYYRMLSTFTTTVRSNIDVELDPEKARQEREAWESTLAPLKDAVAQYETQLQPKFAEWVKAGGESTATPTWTVLDLDLKSQAGAKFTKQADGSYLATGANGNHDTYTATASTKLRRLTGLRLEALADPSMPKKGPGRAPNGNFGLSRITVRAGQVGGEAKPVALTKPQVTFEQNNSSLSIAGSLDDNPGTGWAVDPQFGKDHAAVFTFAEPIDFAEGTQLTITLEFQVNGQHNIGRPRLAVISDVEPSLQADTVPMAVAELLQKVKAATPLTDVERNTLFDWWKRRDADWRARQAKVDEQIAKQPKTTTSILICGEGYKPMRHHSQGADFFEQTFILDRGSTDRKRDVATQSFLQVLMPAESNEQTWKTTPPEGAKFSGRRTAMANWITDVDHGAGALAARVIVNRLWQHHFGTGLVPTSNDFGQTGMKPSHPELLDWLAAELIRHDWKLKPIHRLLMTSATYQQAAAASDEEASDEAVALFVRRRPQRLEGESLRDSLLAISGKLDPTMYGPGTKDERSLRRSIYFTMKRSQLIGSMVVFDQPEPLVSQGSRPVTTVAPQALLLMNGPQVREWAEALARRVEADSNSSTDFAPAVQRIFAMALNRAPTDVELTEAKAFLEQESASYIREGNSAPRTIALADFCQVMFALNEFAYID